MRKKRLVVYMVVALLVIAGTVAAQPANYRAHLLGTNQVPDPLDTRAQGQAIFQLGANGTEMHYRLIVSNIENVWMAHIHLAPADENGPIVVWLFPDMPPPPPDQIPGRFDGVLAEGTFTADDLFGPLAGNTLQELMQAIEAGNTYVNVHTNDFVDPPNTGPGDFPPGEIRGQIR